MPEAAPVISATGLSGASGLKASIRVLGHAGAAVSTASSRRAADVARAPALVYIAGHDPVRPAVRPHTTWPHLSGAHQLLRHLPARRGADGDRSNRQEGAF